VYKQPLTLLKGVGEKKAQKLKKIGLATYSDVLYDFPHRYVDRREVKHVSDIAHQDLGVIIARVVKKRTKYIQKTKKEMLILDVTEGYYTGEVLFFTAKYLVDQFIEGESYYLYGKLEKNGPSFKMIQPDYAKVAERAFLGIIPVYSATLGVTQNELISVHKQVLNELSGQIEETLPKFILNLAHLIPLEDALWEIHFPKSRESYLAAKKRLVYEELFFLQLRLILLKKNYHKPLMVPLIKAPKLDEDVENLPFKLTDAQIGVLEDIFRDMGSGFSMNRLVQGDVGSGKTIVAFLAILFAVYNSKQAVLLSPTTLLAEQHFENFTKMFPEVSCRLLISSVTNAEKKKIKEEIASGEAMVIIGTHAIIQEDVIFLNLGLVITDEQHRFGIRQRLSALQKAEKPHALIMSATPIPRTLSLILYGDMDISIINQMPEGRIPIKTHFVNDRKLDEMYAFILKQLKDGRQGYVICPLIEASETMDLNDAETIFEEMKVRFAPYMVGLIHGKMKAADKDDVMHAFKKGEISLLVSTTVIEVGIHVSNATVMLIMNTERFGLSQLHQLRGRVGRGADQSYCFLYSKKLSTTAKQRIETLVNSNDGFEVAEKDLELRGPGEVFGLRQHGIPELKLANLAKHKDVIADVQKHIKLVLEEYNMNHRGCVELVNKQNANLEKWFTL
jgi:ATP-dependent DNA helicase RecG